MTASFKSIKVGTEKYLVLDTEIYDILSDPSRFHCESEVGPWTNFFAKVTDTITGEVAYAHDFVMQYHGFVKGRDYVHLEFLGSFDKLRLNEDYSYSDAPTAPLGQFTPLDCRFENLRRVTKAEANPSREPRYIGVYWDDKRNQWRAFLSEGETASGRHRNLARFHNEEAAARHRDLHLLLENPRAKRLNFSAEDYDYFLDPMVDTVNDIMECQIRTDLRPSGYEAAVWDNPKFKSPKLAFGRFYETEQEAEDACVKYLRGRFGPISFHYRPKPKYVTTKKLGQWCHRCAQKITKGAIGWVPANNRLVPVCMACFDKLDNTEAREMAEVKAILPLAPSDTKFKNCKQCGNRLLATKENFPTYKYKGETRLRGTCRPCCHQKTNPEEKPE